MLIHKSNECPKCGGGHANQCYVVYDNGSYCFSCGFFEGHGENYYAFKSVRNALNISDITKDLDIIRNPKQFSTYILNWLYKYYVYDELIYKYNIYFVPYEEVETKSSRVVGESLLFPMIEDGEVVYMQRRFFPDKQVLSSGKQKSPCLLGSGSDTIVITEDYISALRVAEYVDSICLFGTNLKNDFVKLLYKYKYVIIWLDGDEPGINAALAIKNKLKQKIKQHNRLFAFDPVDIKIAIIKTKQDPKCYKPCVIKNILKVAI